MKIHTYAKGKNLLVCPMKTGVSIKVNFRRIGIKVVIGLLLMVDVEIPF